MRASTILSGAAAAGLVLAGLLTTASAKRIAPVVAKADEGFTLLFNGKDLTGWKVKKSGDVLDGKTDALNKRFVVEGGKAALIIDPEVKGDVIIETAASPAGDLHLKFDFLPGPGCNNDIYLRGLKFDLKAADVKNLKEGEWNAFEIVVVGDAAEFKCNGESIKKVKTKGGATPFGLRAEFGAMKLRSLQVKAAG